MDSIIDYEKCMNTLTDIYNSALDSIRELNTVEQIFVCTRVAGKLSDFASGGSQSLDLEYDMEKVSTIESLKRLSERKSYLIDKAKEEHEEKVDALKEDIFDLIFGGEDGD